MCPLMSRGPLFCTFSDVSINGSQEEQPETEGNLKGDGDETTRKQLGSLDLRGKGCELGFTSLACPCPPRRIRGGRTVLHRWPVGRNNPFPMDPLISRVGGVSFSELVPLPFLWFWRGNQQDQSPLLGSNSYKRDGSPIFTVWLPCPSRGAPTD